MGSQQFCLKWNNHQLNMLTVFDQLLQNEAFVDVTIACDGLSLRAHKMVLSACSPYFQNLFMENPCKHPIVILKDIRYDEMKAIIDFMYKGEVNVSQEQLSALLKTAETLKVKGLAEVTGQAAQQSQAQQQAVKQSVLFESVPARTSPPAKRKKRPPAAAGSPASPGTNNSSHSGSFPRPPSPPSHSHIQSAISLAPIASSVPSTSTSTLHHHEMASEEEHILPSSGLMRVSAAESGPSTSSSEHKNFDPKGFDPLPMNMKEEKVDLDEPPDEVEDLIMEATPEHIEIEPTTDTGFNGSNQEQGSLSQLASVKYGSVYNPSLPSTSGSSTDAPGNWRQEGELSMELFEIDPNMASWNKMGPNHFPRMNVCGFPIPLPSLSPLQHNPQSFAKGKIPKLNLINNPDFTKPVREQLLSYIAEEWMVIIEGSETLGKLVCKLMDALFTSNEMATSSVTGKMSSKACGAKKALDPKKTNLIIAFSMQKFPAETPVTVKQKMAQKCKSEGIKRREASLGLRRRTDPRPGMPDQGLQAPKDH